jgi:chemotaxis response regulator CheB
VQVIGLVLSGGGGDGDTGLRATKEHGGTALALDLVGTAMRFMSRAANSAGYPNDCLPVQKIAPFVGSFYSCYRILPAGFRCWRAVREIP